MNLRAQIVDWIITLILLVFIGLSWLAGFILMLPSPAVVASDIIKTKLRGGQGSIEGLRERINAHEKSSDVSVAEFKVWRDQLHDFQLKNESRQVSMEIDIKVLKEGQAEQRFWLQAIILMAIPPLANLVWTRFKR